MYMPTALKYAVIMWLALANGMEAEVLWITSMQKPLGAIV